jgi:hypothetical protein
MRNDLDIPFPEPGAAIGEPYGRSSYAGRVGGGMDPNTRRLAIIAGGIGGALLLLVGVWSAVGARHAGTPVIEADARPVRERPVNKGGLSVIGADESGLSAATDGKAIVTPAPEAPALAALKATPPAPVVTANATQSASANVPPAGPSEAPPSNFGAAVAVPQAPAVATAPLPTAERVALTPAAPAPVVSPPTPQASTQIARTATPATGNAQVQLAAVGSEEAAQAEWQRLTKKLPDLLGNRRPAVSRTERNGKAFWRVRTGGFADVASATTFCNQVRAKGGSCSLASF